MSEQKHHLCCTVRMIATLVAVMSVIALTLHLTGDLLQSGIVGVVALIYGIGLLLGSCCYLQEKLHDWQHARAQAREGEIAS